MEEIIKLPIQLGFDVATSLTIIGSLFFVIYRIQRNIKSERNQRFDKQARSVAATQLQLSLDMLSNIFIEKVINYSEKTKNNLGRFNADPSIENLVLELKEEGRITEVASNLKDSRAAVKLFFEKLHSEKYKIIPVIDAIEDSSELVNKFNEQLYRVECFHDKHLKGISGLLFEINELSKTISVVKSEYSYMSSISFDNLCAVSVSAITKHTTSIFFNSEYFYWVVGFIPDEFRFIFEKGIKHSLSLNESSDEIKNCYYIFCDSLVQSLLDDEDVKYKYFSQVVKQGVSKQNEMNKICKELLVTFSAILKYLLAKDSGSAKVSKIIEIYKTEEYFDLDKKSR